METNSVAIAQFARAVSLGFLVEEARIEDYEIFGSTPVDLIILSMSRSIIVEDEVPF